MKVEELQYLEVKEPKEITYYQLMIKQPSKELHERWYLCDQSTDYDYLIKQMEWWKNETGRAPDDQFRIFCLKLPA